MIHRILAFFSRIEFPANFQSNATSRESSRCQQQATSRTKRACWSERFNVSAIIIIKAQSSEAVKSFTIEWQSSSSLARLNQSGGV